MKRITVKQGENKISADKLMALAKKCDSMSIDPKTNILTVIINQYKNAGRGMLVYDAIKSLFDEFGHLDFYGQVQFCSPLKRNKRQYYSPHGLNMTRDFFLSNQDKYSSGKRDKIITLEPESSRIIRRNEDVYEKEYEGFKCRSLDGRKTPFIILKSDRIGLYGSDIEFQLTETFRQAIAKQVPVAMKYDTRRSFILKEGERTKLFIGGVDPNHVVLLNTP